MSNTNKGKTIKFWTKEEDEILKNNTISEAVNLLPGRTYAAISFRRSNVFGSIRNEKIKRSYTKRSTNLKSVDLSLVTKIKSNDNSITIGINGHNITADINTIKKLINL